MAVSEYPRAKSYRLGPTTNEFTGIDEATALASRDNYFSSNPSKLAVYDGNTFYLIRITYDSVVRAQGRLAGGWFDYTPFLQGIPGEVASLVSVPVGELPYKLSDGTFGGSNMRVLDNGTILAPVGFGVESGSVTFGDVLKLSEVAGFLGIFNLLNDRQYTIVDFYTPRNAASSEPTVFHLIEPEFEFISQPVDTTNLPDNPLIYDYTVVNNARTNAIKFRTYAAMTNVRIKISQISNGVALKYLPNKTAWEKEIDGLTWALGDNTFDFTDSPVILSAGVQLRFEVRADSVALKGNATGSPYFAAVIQRGVFDDVITDRVYTATDVKAKLESLSSPDKLAKTAIEDAVLSVATRTGDVVLTKADVGLTSVDNTSDVNKPTSTAQQASIDLKMSQHNAAIDPHPQYTTTAEASAAAPVQSINTLTGAVTLDSSNIAENGNLYYTDSRVGSYLAANNYTVKTASSVGAGNAVYVGNTANNISFKSITGTGAATVTNTATEINISVPAAPVTSVNGLAGAVVLNTTNITEASNLYYTDGRVGTYLTTNGYTVKSVTSGGTGASVFNNTSTGVTTLRAINGTGLITVTQNTNDITVSAPLILNGTYTPTITNIANIQAVTGFLCMYTRIGDTITVRGRINIDPTTNGAATSVELTLPVASNLAAIGDLSGVSGCADTQQSGALFGNIATDRAVLGFSAGSNAARDHYFTFTYRVL